MINGTPEDDILGPGPGGPVTINGNAGNDTITGSGDDDRLNGNAGNDTISGLGGDDKIVGGSGADSLFGGAGDDDLTFDADDLASGAVDGGADFDTGRAKDSVSGLNLAAINIERFFGSTGDDEVTAAASTQGVTIVGNKGNDTITGSGFDDRLNGNAGSDTIDGGAGDDIISGGADADVLDGGAGDGDILLATGTSGVSVNLQVDSVSGGNLAGDTISNFEGVVGTNFNDTLTGSNGEDILVGGSGADRLTGSNGVDSLYGGEGDDDLRIDQNDLDGGVVDGGAGFDTIRSNGGVGDMLNLVDMDALNAERFFGASQDDFVFSSGSTSVSVNGNGGNDYVGGGSGDDVLNGNAGADTLNGGAGDDRMNGGGGSDVFLFEGTGDFGNDDVRSFQGGLTDELLFDASMGITSADITTSQVGNGVLISVDDGAGTEGSVILRGVNEADLSIIDNLDTSVSIFEI